MSTDSSTVDEYAEDYKNGAKFPPAVVFYDGSKYYLADGFHRYLACQQLDFKDIKAEIRKGTREDALWYPAGANLTHGLRQDHCRQAQGRRNSVNSQAGHERPRHRESLRSQPSVRGANSEFNW